MKKIELFKSTSKRSHEVTIKSLEDKGKSVSFSIVFDGEPDEIKKIFQSWISLYGEEIQEEV